MGRKIEIKKIEDITKCQVTFSKRRSSLMKKAQEISVCCDVDVAFIAFSPSGRISKFCNKRRIEDVLSRYVNLPAHRRLNHIKNVQEKQQKLRQLDHIKGDRGKSHYLNKQIENLELQIKKRTLELQILEADLRDYEPGPEQDPSLHQLLWCERNLKQSLDRVMARKNDLFGSNSRIQRQQSFQVPKHAETNSMEMSKSGGMLDSYNSDEKEFIKLSEENPSAGQLLRQLDPWISPYRFTFDRVRNSSRVREGIFQLLDKAKGASANQALVTSNVPMTSLPTMHMSGTSSEAHLQASIPSQQPSVAYGQSPPILPNPQPGAIGNTPTVNNLKDGILPFNPVHSSQEQSSSLLDGNSQSLRASQSPSIERTLSPLENASLVTASTSTLKLQAVSEVPQPKDKRKVMSEYLNPNTTFLSLMNAEPVWQPSVDFSGSSNSYNDHSRDNNNNNNWGGDGHRDDNYFAAPEQVNLPAEAPQGSIFNDLCIKDAWEEQTFWTEGIQDRGLWEWDDLDLAGTLNLEDLDFFSK